MESNSKFTPKEVESMLRTKRLNTRSWYVLYVTAQHERKIADIINRKEEADYHAKEINGKLTNADYKIMAYVPTQKVKRKWSDRVVEKETVIIPGVIFVRLKMIDKQRIYLDSNIRMFLYNKQKREPEPIPDWQMYQFQSVVANTTHLSMEEPQEGDTVKVEIGTFKGFVGELIQGKEGKSKFQIRIAGLAFPITINKEDVIKVEPGTSPELPDELWH